MEVYNSSSPAQKSLSSPRSAAPNKVTETFEYEDEGIFVSSPSQTLYCPICMLLFRRAVITKECGKFEILCQIHAIQMDIYLLIRSHIL